MNTRKSSAVIVSAAISFCLALYLSTVIDSFLLVLMITIPVYFILIMPLYYLITDINREERRERARKYQEMSRQQHIQQSQQYEDEEYDENEYYEEEDAEEMDMDNQYYESNHDSSEPNPWNP